jgi:hypothetical protein
LGDVVVECEDRAGKVERCVEGVGDVVAEGIVVSLGGGADTVAFGEVGRIKLFLLGRLS